MSDKEVSTTVNDAEVMTRLRDLINDIRVAMVTTTGEKGVLHSRPMYSQQAAADGDLWFATSRSSDLVKDLLASPHILASFADTGNQRYVVVRGEGAVNHDSAKIAELWNPKMDAWFPDGPTDPDLTLVHLRAERADVWDAPSGPARLVNYVTALVTGTKPETGDRLHVDLGSAAERIDPRNVGA